MLLRRTRAIFRSAELGFLGVIVRTCRQTPRFCGAPGMGSWRCRRLFQFFRNAGALTLRPGSRRPLRMSWLMVGTEARLLSVRSLRFAEGPTFRSVLGLPQDTHDGGVDLDRADPAELGLRVRAVDADPCPNGRLDDPGHGGWRRIRGDEEALDPSGADRSEVLPDPGHPL